jgi:hypothetical protein
MMSGPLVAAYFLRKIVEMTPTKSSDQFAYRFDIYVCLCDRLGNPVENGKFRKVKNQILERFGGLTMTSIFGNPIYDGFWISAKSKQVVRDKNSIFTVLAPQSEETREYFMAKREEWEKLLNYEKLLITVHELQIL